MKCFCLKVAVIDSSRYGRQLILQVSLLLVFVIISYVLLLLLTIALLMTEVPSSASEKEQDSRNQPDQISPHLL